MATLNLIAEPFPDFEAPVHLAAVADLTNALASTAPRGCSVRYLAAKDAAPAEFASPKVSVDALPIRASALPVLWQSGTSARPLDGEMTHAFTPMVPLRSRNEDDGTQTTVNVPNALAWQAPELLHPAHVRLSRSFIKRAIKHADVVITSTHAHAELLQEHFSFMIPLQVVPPAAPSQLLAGPDAAERRARLGLPDRYVVTTAQADEFGRLQWIFDAYLADASLPPLAIIAGLDPEKFVKGSPARRDPGTGTVEVASVGDGPSAAASDPVAAAIAATVPAQLASRVHVVSSADLRDAGATLAGAALLLQPQAFSPTGYTIVAALASRVPVLHAGDAAVAELAVDAGIAEPTREGFIGALSRLSACTVTTSSADVAPDSASVTAQAPAAVSTPASDGLSELEMLAVHAGDRGRTFSWRGTAWQLWETHAAI